MKKIFALILCIIMCFATATSTSALWQEIDTDDHAHIDLSVIEDWYAEAYEFVLREAIMSDIIVKIDIKHEVFWVYYSDFHGQRDISRAEVACILHRYDGNTVTKPTHYPDFDGQGPYCDSTCDAFVDVPDGVWYTPAAQWANENSIINGVGGAYFAPDRTITREEFAAMLYRYTNYLEVDTTARVDYSDYADSESVSDWATDAMSWAVAEGLINGKPGKLLAPQDTITRAEVATVIYRFNNEVKAHRDIWDGSY